MAWEEREVELITQVLCVVEDLPDRPVYEALAGVRDAVKSGDKKRMMRATLGLTETFLECVREAFRIGVGESPWSVLARQSELNSWAQRLEQRVLGPAHLHSDFLQEFVEANGIEDFAEVARLAAETERCGGLRREVVGEQILGLLATVKRVRLDHENRS